MTRRIARAIVLSLAVLVAPVLRTSSSAQELDFEFTAPTTGSISYDGQPTGTLMGSGIDVDLIVGLNTPVNNNVGRVCFSCTFSFTSGSFTSSTSTNWTFAAGGTVALTGGVDLDNNGSIGAGDIPLGTTLFQGTFQAPVTVTTLVGGFRVLGGAFTDTMTSALAAFYGVPNGAAVYSGGLNLSFASGIAPPNAFNSTQLLSGNMANSAPEATPTPTLTHTPTATPSNTATKTPTNTPSNTATSTRTASPTSTITPTKTVSSTRTPTTTGTATATPTHTFELIEETPTPQAAVDLAIEKHFADAACGRGAPGLYVLLVRNLGDQTTPALPDVSDTLPSGVTLVSASGTGFDCSPSTATMVHCVATSLFTTGESRTINVSVTIAMTADIALVNTATVAGQTGELDLTNNTSTIVTLCTGGPTGVPAVGPLGFAVAIVLLGGIALWRLRGAFDQSSG